MRRGWTYVLACLGYTAFWLVTRWPAIAANPLFFDDFALPATPAAFYIGSYRPFLWLEYRFWELLIPGHFWTHVPKLAAAIYLGLFATALAALLRKWNVPPAIAFATPLVVLANPVLNDAGLWNSLHALPLALALITAAAVVWEREDASWRMWLGGAALLLCGIFGYQIFVSLAVVYLLAEPAVKTLTGVAWNWRASLRKLVAIAAVTFVQLVYMQLTRTADSDPRGLLHATSFRAYLLEKLHGLIDLAVNGVMPILAYAGGVRLAYRTWYYVPLVLGVLLAIATWRRFGASRALLYGAGPLALFFAPSLPCLISSADPYAWRVSSPVAVSLALSLMMLLLVLARDARAASAVLAVAAILVAPIGHYEASLRVISVERDARLLRELGNARAVSYVGPALGAAEDERLAGPHLLTWGYEVRTPAMWSGFSNAWTTAYFLRHVAPAVAYVDCSPAMQGRVCDDARSLCARSSPAAARPLVAQGEGVVAVCAPDGRANRRITTASSR
ncbi:MAG: hypothetical protein JO197_06965 [Acidobacteria bacterium]|nr:hypothetical protein [Acidobacteriota bacterium]MBV9477594.1 hypothetical protein [Acidobacteriota bacterium]